ncbi:MAG TPA: maleate cis-trans isomerase [Chloroflexota bacterium]|jgi:maleate isomerase
MWRPDGWGWRARIGVLTPHRDVGPESEFRAMAPDGVSVHAARVPFGATAAGGTTTPTIALEPVRAFADPPHVDDAAELLAAAPLHAIAFGFTSSSYVRGPADDAALKARLEERTRGIPVAITCTSAVLALRALGARRLALIDPPWFPAELTARGAEYFRGCGFEVVHAAPAGLPSGQRLVHPGALYEWARAHVPPEAEAVFVGGNGFRAVGAIEALEEDLGRPVLSANQVVFWHALRLAGTRAPVVGYGRIFGREMPGS